MFGLRERPQAPHCASCGRPMRPAQLSPCLFDGRASRGCRSEHYVYCRLFDDIICLAVNCYVTAVNEGFSEDDIRAGCPTAMWAEGPGLLSPAPAVINPSPVTGYHCPHCGATDRLLEKRNQWQHSRQPRSE